MKKIFTGYILLMSGTILFGQGNSDWRENAVLRTALVDSLVNKSFWNAKAEDLSGFRIWYKKSDFSENAKKTLLSYFDRTLPDYEIKKRKENAKFTVNNSIERLRSEAEKKGLDFDSLYNAELEKQTRKNIEYISEDARSRVSPLYARLLGWLDYKPAVHVLEAVLTDSLKHKDYAADNKTELALSCKLALARMGNKKYEKEVIDYYKTVELNCAYRYNFCNPMNDLFYINTHTSINAVLEFAKNTKIYQEFHPDAYKGIVIPPCTAKPAVYLYLSNVIKNYPIVDSDDIEIMKIPYDPVEWSWEEFYSEQIPKLEKWMEDNKNTYEIDTEKWF